MNTKQNTLSLFKIDASKIIAATNRTTNKLFTYTNFSQLIIVISASLAVYMTQSPLPSIAACAPIVGLIGQPFFLIETINKKQWGMFILAVFYTAIWIKGALYNVPFYIQTTKALIG